MLIVTLVCVSDYSHAYTYCLLLRSPKQDQDNPENNSRIAIYFNSLARSFARLLTLCSPKHRSKQNRTEQTIHCGTSNEALFSWINIKTGSLPSKPYCCLLLKLLLLLLLRFLNTYSVNWFACKVGKGPKFLNYYRLAIITVCALALAQVQDTLQWTVTSGPSCPILKLTRHSDHMSVHALS